MIQIHGVIHRSLLYRYHSKNITLNTENSYLICIIYVRIISSSFTPSHMYQDRYQNRLILLRYHLDLSLSRIRVPDSIRSSPVVSLVELNNRNILVDLFLREKLRSTRIFLRSLDRNYQHLGFYRTLPHSTALNSGIIPYV